MGALALGPARSCKLSHCLMQWAEATERSVDDCYLCWALKCQGETKLKPGKLVLVLGLRLLIDSYGAW